MNANQIRRASRVGLSRAIQTGNGPTLRGMAVWSMLTGSSKNKKLRNNLNKS
jgi:hypothetical protein